jgi:hypothetical protein
MTGRRFGSLLVLRRVGSRAGKATWLCRCDCGIEKEIVGHDLRAGSMRSCGCRRRAVLAAQKRRHGHRFERKTSRTYATWAGITARCRNPNHRSYPNYGGRGITVCDRWLDFRNFSHRHGERPPRRTIERKDNDRGYSPDNCRWATRTQQARNRRSTRLVPLDGRMMPLAEALAKQGLRPGTFFMRMRRGWPLQRALTELPD